MRKTLIYIVILAALSAGIYFLLPNPDKRNPYTVEEAGFNIKDTGAIGRIFIATPGGDQMLVERTDTGWMVNRQYKALASTLNMLLNTFVKQEPLYPVTKNAYDNAVRVLSTHGIKVEVYDRQGKKMRVFYVGGVAVNNSGTNMLMEGASTPYVVEMPGFVGYLTPHYTARMIDWRDRTVFRLPEEEIASVRVNYTENPAYNFTISRDENDSLSVKADKPGVIKPGAILNRRRAKAYMGFFGNVNCEGYLNGTAGLDSTISEAPKRGSVTVTTRQGVTSTIDIYWMPANRRSKNQKADDMSAGPQDYDADRMYGVTNGGKDTMLIQQLTFEPLLRKAPEFYAADIARHPTTGAN